MSNQLPRLPAADLNIGDMHNGAPLTEAEYNAIQALQRDREAFDEAADLRERAEAKMQLAWENPGLEVELDPEEAEFLGLIKEEAMSYEDAIEGAIDGWTPEMLEAADAYEKAQAEKAKQAAQESPQPD